MWTRALCLPVPRALPLHGPRVQLPGEHQHFQVAAFLFRNKSSLPQSSIFFDIADNGCTETHSYVVFLWLCRVLIHCWKKVSAFGFAIYSPHPDTHIITTTNRLSASTQMFFSFQRLLPFLLLLLLFSPSSSSPVVFQAQLVSDSWPFITGVNYKYA